MWRPTWRSPNTYKTVKIKHKSIIPFHQAGDPCSVPVPFVGRGGVDGVGAGLPPAASPSEFAPEEGAPLSLTAVSEVDFSELVEPKSLDTNARLLPVRLLRLCGDSAAACDREKARGWWVVGGGGW